MRTIPDSFDPAMVAAIDARLDAVARDERVSLPLVIESGSRAWGFASPDSDYDCRFIYVRQRRDYLALWPKRDVIETPLDGLLDVNGWDLAKALRLIVKGNAVAIEWLRSPIAYRGDEAFRDALDAFAVEHMPVDAVQSHYLHLGLQQWSRHGEEVTSGKKLFYALRPAAALRWIRLHDQALPPMHFPTLMAECDPPADVAVLVADLITRKAETRELGEAIIPAEIAAFIENEYGLAANQQRDRSTDDKAKAAADALFMTLLDRFSPDD
ncbi:nucleotidyltransferase domain-containing protein [Sphingomonas alpina]|uniref:Nucleotidyltransferase domain-containing protein n=1 Tax=Sphingomonas alpina TaxID=653931 RepID=A0A7H0LKB2_9SPHN|nr:nucleotidyltransferase domain-containing protein [Sphingomonas alpina]QNQ10115.1 nucleotidyltransferase domain-containing protein [Sphingomonas alpina]